MDTDKQSVSGEDRTRDGREERIRRFARQAASRAATAAANIKDAGHSFATKINKPSDPTIGVVVWIVLICLAILIGAA